MQIFLFSSMVNGFRIVYERYKAVVQNESSSMFPLLQMVCIIENGFTVNGFIVESTTRN